MGWKFLLKSQFKSMLHPSVTSTAVILASAISATRTCRQNERPAGMAFNYHPEMSWRRNHVGCSHFVDEQLFDWTSHEIRFWEALLGMLGLLTRLQPVSLKHASRFLHHDTKVPQFPYSQAYIEDHCYIMGLTTNSSTKEASKAAEAPRRTPENLRRSGLQPTRITVIHFLLLSTLKNIIVSNAILEKSYSA